MISLSFPRPFSSLESNSRSWAIVCQIDHTLFFLQHIPHSMLLLQIQCVWHCKAGCMPPSRVSSSLSVNSNTNLHIALEAMHEPAIGASECSLGACAAAAPSATARHNVTRRMCSHLARGCRLPDDHHWEGDIPTGGGEGLNGAGADTYRRRQRQHQPILQRATHCSSDTHTIVQ